MGQSLPKLAIIYAVAIWLIICIMRRAKNNFELISSCLGEDFAINDVFLEMMPLLMPFAKKIPRFIRSSSAAVILHNRSPKETILSLYQVDVQTKHAQNEKHFNSTKRNKKDDVERSTIGIVTRVLVDVSWSSGNILASHSSLLPKQFPCFIRSIPSYVKQNKQTLKPCRRQAKQTLESIPQQDSKL